MYPSISPSTYLSIYLSVCLSIYLSICKLENEAILRDVLKVWTWQHQKRSNSARLLHSSKLTTSKTKQFCETSFKNRKLSAALTASYQCVSRFFQSICLNYCARHEKLMPGRYEVLHLSRKIISANLQIGCSKMQPLSGNQCPDLQTALMNMSLVLRLPRKMHLCRSSSNGHHSWKCYKTLTFWSLLTRCTIPCACHAKRHLNLQEWSVHGVLCTFSLRNVLRATTACTFSTPEPPKVVRQWCVLYILTSKCASHHNGVHFFDISTSKSGPRICVVCYILTWKCASRHCATTACNFSSLIWPAGSAPAALASLLFDPPETQIIGKTQCFATFLLFRAPASSFFWLFLFSDLLSSLSSALLSSFSSALLSATLLFSLTLPISAFHLSKLSEVWLLNFLR